MRQHLRVLVHGRLFPYTLQPNLQTVAHIISSGSLALLPDAKLQARTGSLITHRGTVRISNVGEGYGHAQTR